MKKIHKPLPTHNRVHFDKKEIISIVGPWGSGKSTIGAIELAHHCRKYRCDGLVVRDTYPALRDSCCKKWEELFQGQGEMHWGPPPTWKWTNEMKGTEILFRSAESPEDIQKFGSVEVGGVWLEEVTPGLMPGGVMNIGMAPEVLSGALGRIRKWGRHDKTPECSTDPAKACNHKKLFVTALPPPSVKHWFYKLFYDKRPFLSNIKQDVMDELFNQVALYRIHPDENKANLPENYYQLQTAFLTSEDQILRFINGEVGSAYSHAGVYSEQWNDDQHINKDIHETPGPMILGVDGGLDASAVWLQIQESGRLFVLAELCTHGLGLEDFGMLVQQKGSQLFGPRMYDVWTDPAVFSRSQNNARDGAWYLSQAGLTAKPCFTNDPKVRWNAVRSWLGRFGRSGPLLQVHPRCENLIEGMRGAYRWKISGGVPIVGSVEKNEYSHPHDALQYPLASLLSMSKGDTTLPPLGNTDLLGRFGRSPSGLAKYTRRSR